MLGTITKTEKILAMTTIAVALVASGYNFLIDPLIRDWNELEKEITAKEIVLTKHNRILRSKESIEKSHSEYVRFFQKEKSAPEEESAMALGSIEKIAREANVRITNIKPLSARTFENYNKFTFRVATESRMSELTKFIYNLQSSDQILKIERMILRAKERSPDTIKASLQVTKVSVF